MGMEANQNLLLYFRGRHLWRMVFRGDGPTVEDLGFGTYDM